MKIKKKKSTSLGEKLSLSERYVSTFFAIYSRKQKSKMILAGLLTFPSPRPSHRTHAWHFPTVAQVSETFIFGTTAAGTVPDFLCRSPDSLLSP